MNVDTHLHFAPAAAQPLRPAQRRPDTTTERPVERPNEAAASEQRQPGTARAAEPRSEETRTGNNAAAAEQSPANESPADDAPGVRQASELDPNEQRQLEQLQARDREVRAHEAAHKAAAGGLARGGAEFEFQTGPDGRRYAVGGEVSIDTGRVSGNPEATIANAQTVRRAATAPAEPSAQDRAVAAEATRIEAEARQELSETRREEVRAAEETPAEQQRHGFSSNPTEPAPVGELLDVIA